MKKAFPKAMKIVEAKMPKKRAKSPHRNKMSFDARKTLKPRETSHKCLSGEFPSKIKEKLRNTVTKSPAIATQKTTLSVEQETLV